VGGAVLRHVVDGMHIGVDYSLEAITFRLENVAIESKAMRSIKLLKLTTLKFASEAEQRELFVSVVELENITN